MNGKLKALGLGLVATTVIGAFAAVSASAFTPLNSHFTSSVHHITVRGSETAVAPSTHGIHIQRTVNGAPNGEPIGCKHVAYHGTLSGAAATTTQSISLRPEYKECSTGTIAPYNVTIHVPAVCGTEVFQLTSGNPGTVHLKCELTITHPNCTVRIPPQTLTGATYTQVAPNGVHELTPHILLNNVTGHFEAGFCSFLGTAQTYHFKGSLTLWGENATGRVPITHTTP
jgi:hypothetical protein